MFFWLGSLSGSSSVFLLSLQVHMHFCEFGLVLIEGCTSPSFLESLFIFLFYVTFKHYLVIPSSSGHCLCFIVWFWCLSIVSRILSVFESPFCFEYIYFKASCFFQLVCFFNHMALISRYSILQPLYLYWLFQVFLFFCCLFDTLGLLFLCISSFCLNSHNSQRSPSFETWSNVLTHVVLWELIENVIQSWTLNSIMLL